MDKLLRKLKGKKSHGLDWICGFSLKLGSSIVRDELKLIINLSISSGKFCEEWKKAKILPVYKCKGSRLEQSSYRPVSNLPETSKLVEMAIFEQVYEYFENNNLLHADHHGFMKNRSTITAIQQLRDYWLNNADKGKLSSAILLDLRAGFDVVNLKILQTKLKIYGFDENSLAWFKTYLEGRSQCVQIESKLSPLLGIPWGVPQGGQLSPLLFTIFIMELPEVIKDEESKDSEHEEEEIKPDKEEAETTPMTVIYADFNTPSCSANNLEALENKTQQIANRAVNWFTLSEMVISTEKTKILFMGSEKCRRSKIPSNYKTNIIVNEEQITLSTSEKLLGLTINETLSWSSYLYGDETSSGLLRTLSKRVGLLAQLRKFMKPQKFISVFNGIFMSKMVDGIIAWGYISGIPGQTSEFLGGTSRKDILLLQVIHNKPIRLIFY